MKNYETAFAPYCVLLKADEIGASVYLIRYTAKSIDHPWACPARAWHVDSTHLKNVTHAHHMDASTLYSEEGRGQLR
ncbi:MAG: hypothetical protein Greene041662_15 [Candidatus Peregrinibacteria bacterium Greene0416_62]|nr:MAG: hypothetical protein Greene041662_15 [Candidatus Peregrinibacteria bacterium Greene0416_62]